MAFKVITHRKIWRYFSAIIHLQYIVKICVSIRSRFGLKTNFDLFYFSFTHTMKTWAKYRNHWNDSQVAAVRLGSISSRFVSPRSLPHTTAGSLVYPLYFLTNHSQACSNRAGFLVIGQFSHSFIQHGGCQCWWLSATKCVSERFHIGKFRAITARCRSEFVKRERCFSFTAIGHRKIRNFQPFPIICIFDVA